MLDRTGWTPAQLERNDFVRFRTEFMFDRFVPHGAGDRMRILDFGCGEGHSLGVLVERFRDADFVAADFASKPLAFCEAQFKGNPRVRVVRMETPEDIEQIGSGFCIIQLNAVFEHLLPHERPLLMSDLWTRLSDNGYLVITETPWRWFPIETHCTSLPFINYLPDRLALAAFRSRARFPDDATMEYALRDGLRGATAREIIKSLDAAPGTVRLVQSGSTDARDLLDCWWHGECRKTRQKEFAYKALSLLRALSGITVSPWLNFVLQKKPI